MLERHQWQSRRLSAILTAARLIRAPSLMKFYSTSGSLRPRLQKRWDSRQHLHDILAEKKPVSPNVAARIGKPVGNGPAI
ncbi:hypothetical protein ABIF61_006845 [Bradyrhizobium japonicum]